MANKRSSKPYRLTALGRVAASTRDAMGDTLGSFSGLALEPGSWRASSGGVTGVLVTLPDRGFNIPEKGKFSDYPARLHRFRFELKGEGLSLDYLGTRLLRDARGALMTGIDPGNGRGEQFGALVPMAKKGPGAKRISIDSEGLAIAADGRFFVSDEFAANIYCFAPDGAMTDVVAPPEAFVPHVDGEISFSSADGTKVERGRAPNDGFEGLSLSPDGRTLFALLQSPLVQDRKGPAYTRLVCYDVSARGVSRRPSAHFAVELPRFDDGTAEVNEVVALGKGRVLVLARESFGYGAKARNAGKPIAFKQVLMGSLADATDLAGTKYERKARSLLQGGELDDGIVPVKLTPFVDIADEEELNRLGLTARTPKRGLRLLSAKWESLVLSPPLDARRPRERLLFVGNDNDFRTRSASCRTAPMTAGSSTIISCSSTA